MKIVTIVGARPLVERTTKIKPVILSLLCCLFNIPKLLKLFMNVVILVDEETQYPEAKTRIMAMIDHVADIHGTVVFNSHNSFLLAAKSRV